MSQYRHRVTFHAPIFKFYEPSVFGVREVNFYANLSVVSTEGTLHLLFLYIFYQHLLLLKIFLETIIRSLTTTLKNSIRNFRNSMKHRKTARRCFLFFMKMESQMVSETLRLIFYPDVSLPEDNLERFVRLKGRNIESVRSLFFFLVFSYYIYSLFSHLTNRNVTFGRCWV